MKDITLHLYQEEAVNSIIREAEESLDNRKRYLHGDKTYLTVASGYEHENSHSIGLDSEVILQRFPHTSEECRHYYAMDNDGAGHLETPVWTKPGCPIHTKNRSIVNSSGQREIASDDSILLHAPTGSGKTIILYETMRRLEASRALTGRGVVFVFIAPNTLHEQAMSSFERNLTWQGGLIDIESLTPMHARGLASGDVLFMNYAGSNKDGNLINRENERGIVLDKIMEATRKESDIVLIVDEAHNAAATAKSQELFLKIFPDLTINATATPILKNGDWVPGKHVRVRHEDVIEAGQIVDDVRFNDEYAQLISDMPEEAQVDANSPYIWASVRKRESLSSFYLDEESSVNPLIGIQIPSQVNSKGEYRSTEYKKDDQEEIELTESTVRFLENNFGWTIENGDIAIWLANRKENLEGISHNQSPVKAIIFKTAIAVGWDCPRLKVLAMLRDNRSAPFSVQTIGRATRQPEQKRYTNESLNHAYAYTSFDTIESDLDTIQMARERGTDITVSTDTCELLTRYQEQYHNALNLPNWSEVWIAPPHISTQTILNEFRQKIVEFTGRSTYEEALQADNPKELITQRFGFAWKLATQGTHLAGHSINIDELANHNLAKQSHNLTPPQLERLLEERISDSVKAVTESTLLASHIRWALALMVQEIRAAHPEFTETLFARIVLAKENQRGFSAFIRDITYTLVNNGVGRKQQQHVQHGKYNLPSIQRRQKGEPIGRALERQKDWYLYGHQHNDAQGYPPQSQLDILDSEAEEMFQRDIIPYIHQFISQKVDDEDGIDPGTFGYFKSGTQNKVDLAIPYTYQKVNHLFYPDWIILYKKKGISHLLIVETKRENLTGVTNAKAQTLQKFCRDNSRPDLVIEGTVLNISRRGTPKDSRDVITRKSLDDYLKDIREEWQFLP